MGLKCRVGKEKGRSDTDIPHVGIQAAGFCLFKTLSLQNIRIRLSHLRNSMAQNPECMQSGFSQLNVGASDFTGVYWKYTVFLNECVVYKCVCVDG